MFKKVLIANRGEIAIRIAKSLQELGIEVVAVYSENDAQAPHLRYADHICRLEGQSLGQTYLNVDQIVDIAKAHHADALHPGYGFLSENAALPRACANAGITFIGPTAEVIESMGDKITAKAKMTAAKVPTVPGWSSSGEINVKDLQTEAERIGYPVMLKAAAGGGGKGMRIVHEPDQLSAALEAARREADSAFGDARVFLEKYIVRPRHIEFQIFGDAHGNVVHLFERECSIQRRHQKIIEESPSPIMTPKLRKRMADAAIRAAKAMGYTNAGTVEFIVDQAGDFYFLEVNTRLQVEHPVTELVTRRDLVRAQLAVAAGQPLPFTQKELEQHGHAIECRVYAEDSTQGFLPATGRVLCYEAPEGPNVRVDSGIAMGSEVTVHFDPMLAKVIVWGQDRSEALRRMRWALRRFVILGVTTNLSFLHALLDHPDVVRGDMHTQFLDDTTIADPSQDVPTEAFIAAGLAGSSRSAVSEHAGVTDSSGPWSALGPWRVAR